MAQASRLFEVEGRGFMYARDSTLRSRDDVSGAERCTLHRSGRHIGSVDTSLLELRSARRPAGRHLQPSAPLAPVGVPPQSL